MNNNQQPTRTKREKVWNIVGIVLCVLLIPILILNMTLIINSFIHKDKVPGIFGRTPLMVLSGSMEPKIKEGDLIISKDVNPKDIKVGDVISFFDPMSTKDSVVTHRVIAIDEVVVKQKDGTSKKMLQFTTRGDANNDRDYKPVLEDRLVGIYTGTRIPLLGSILEFMQTTLGLIVCIGVPLVALITYELLRRRKYEKSNNTDVDKMRAELEALRAEKERLAAEQAKKDTPPNDKDEG